MMEVKGVGRRTQLLDDLRNRRRYWELKEEAEDRKRWRRQFINRTSIFHKSLDLLISSILNNNTKGPKYTVHIPLVYNKQPGNFPCSHLDIDYIAD